MSERTGTRYAVLSMSCKHELIAARGRAGLQDRLVISATCGDERLVRVYGPGESHALEREFYGCQKEWEARRLTFLLTPDPAAKPPP